uniref:Kazal-like domain-containing protein n=1 Tax=Globisporangium ultimum (strain ATCC 200006 / CBS 805.95 / DAOM BR144) TaxID=431595 RepID=K3X4L0_GLOUD
MNFSAVFIMATVVASTVNCFVNAASCHPDSCIVSVPQLLCGSDGVTYRSICELELAQCTRPDLKIASMGACGNEATATTTKCSEQEACEESSYPICGSDGVTYQNACYFDRAYCKNNDLVPMGYGTCKTSTTSTPALRG